MLKSRFPSVHDHRTLAWGKAVGRLMARGRWARGDFSAPGALRTVRRLAQRESDDSQAYGHLRAPSPALA